MNLNNLTSAQLAKMICNYNGQKGTEKQVNRILKFYPNKESLINFLKPRI